MMHKLLLSDEFLILKIVILLFLLIIFVSIWFWKFLLRLQDFYEKVPSHCLDFPHLIQYLFQFYFKPRYTFNDYSVLAVLLQGVLGMSLIFKNESIFALWLNYFPFVIINKPEAIEEVLNGTKMLEKGWFYKWLHDWLGEGLLTSHGQKWKSRRKMLTPSFHFDILKDFLPIINEKSMLLVDKLKKEATKEYVDITSPLTLCSLDIICETTLGINIDAQQNSESEYIKAVSRVTDVLPKRLINLLHWFDWTFYLTPTGKVFKEDLCLLHEFTRKVIQEKKSEMLTTGYNDKKLHKRKPLIEVLLEHHIKTKDLTEEDIREEVDTFTFEGHDTTAMAMIWALYLIGLHEDVQNKLYEELYQIFGNDTDRAVTPDDLKYFKYLDCVLKETLRLYPSVPVVARKAEEDITIGGYPLLKEIAVVISPYCLHRNEDIYPNSEIFDPNRFTPENSAKRHPYAYLPFSAGSRNCIGQRFAMMEEKVTIANIIRNFDLKSLDPRDKMVPSFETILRPPLPVRIRFRPRQVKH